MNYIVHKDLVELSAWKHLRITRVTVLISPEVEVAASLVTFVQELS